MLVSTGLNSIAFLSSSDSTRLQMSAKQLAQSVTGLNCRLPYVIGKDYPYLSHTSRLFKKTADYDGEVLYSNEDLLIVGFIDDKDISKIETYNIPKYKHTANNFATTLRNRLYSGSFDKGDVLYEYDCFNQDVPCYGYNANVLYFPWFGYNFEDSIVISDSFAKRATSTKIKSVSIFVYKNSTYKFIYPNSRYGFLPEIGQKINRFTITSQYNNKYMVPGAYTNQIEQESDPNNQTCKLENAMVAGYKIHRVDSKRYNLIDKQLETYINNMRVDYASKIREYSADLQSAIGVLTSDILKNNYIMQDSRVTEQNRNELMYIIELDLVKESPSKMGDKLANRFSLASL
jgi:hypothetical protein